MDEEQNISDAMSSLLHAAEEWANGRSRSYPFDAPFEEVIRIVISAIYENRAWIPETDVNNRLPRRNAGYALTTSETPILRNNVKAAIIPPTTLTSRRSDSTAISNVFKTTSNHQPESSPRAAEPLAKTSEDILNKTFTISRNASFNESKQWHSSDQTSHNNNEIFTIKQNVSLEMSGKLNDGNVEQKPETVASYPTFGIAPCLAKNSKKVTATEHPKNNQMITISLSDDHFDKSNKERLPSSEEQPENMKRKFYPITPEKLTINCRLNTAPHPAITDHQQFHNKNFISSNPQAETLKEIKKILEVLAIGNSESNDIDSQSNLITTAHENRNTVKPGYATAGNNGIATKNAITVLTSNGTATETNTFTTNELIQPAFPKVSMNDGYVDGNVANVPKITNLSENDISVNCANITLQKLSNYADEKEKNLSVINSMQINATQNDASKLSEENLALIIKLNEDVIRSLISNYLSQFVIQKPENHNFISTAIESSTLLGQCQLAIAKNSNPAIEEFKSTTLAISPKISTATQIESNIYPYNNENDANLGKNLNIGMKSPKPLFINEKDTDSVVNINNDRSVEDGHTQITLSHLKNRRVRINSTPAFQTMIQNNIPGHDLYFKNITEKELIIKQTDLENTIATYNDACDKFDSTPSRRSNKKFGKKPLLTKYPLEIQERSLEKKRLPSNEPIEFLNYMASPPRRKSLQSARGILNSNKFGTAIKRSARQPKTIREIISKTPTLMTPISAAKPNVKQSSKPVHRTRPINPPKKPNELPLENRASRLKAEYLAKKLNEQEKKLEMKRKDNLTPAIAVRSSVIRKRDQQRADHCSSSIPLRNVVKPISAERSNLPPRSNANN